MQAFVNKLHAIKIVRALRHKHTAVDQIEPNLLRDLIDFEAGCMMEAEHLDALVEMVVREITTPGILGCFSNGEPISLRPFSI